MIRLDLSVEHSVENVLGVSQAVFLPTFILVKPDKLRPIVNGKRANAAQVVESFKANYLQKLRDTVEKNDFAVQVDIQDMYYHCMMGPRLQAASYAIVYEPETGLARILELLAVFFGTIGGPKIFQYMMLRANQVFMRRALVRIVG